MIEQSRFERPAVIAAFLVYLVFQFHAVVFHGYSGQDWITHLGWVRLAANEPWEFFRHYSTGRTNPPIYHLLGGAIRRIAGLRSYQADIGIMNAVFGFIGMCSAYGVMRRLIASPILRTAGIIFLLFLPFAMIHAEVVAADALATPLFWLLLYLLIRFRPEAPDREFGIWILLTSFLLVVAVLVKFTFSSFLIAVGMWAIALWWTKLVSWRRLALMLVLMVIVPAAIVYHENDLFRPYQGDSLGLAPPAHLSDANMNPRSVMWLRSADTDVLYAPAYNWLEGGSYKLLLRNEHSFPALLHLAMFTDILNIYQSDPYDQYFGRRTLQNHHRMRTAVRSAIVFSVLAVISVITLLIGSTIRTVFRRDPQDLGVFTILLFCLGWFAGLVVLLPLVPGAYDNGWWLPRLYAPSLIGFFLVSFVFLDRVKWISKKLQMAVLVIVLAQTSLQASFLWPTRSEGRLYESNSDIAMPLVAPVVRVINWQNGWDIEIPSGEYSLADSTGIVVYRPVNPSGLENWKVRFVLSAGPSLPTPHGVVRISSRNFEPKLVEFDGTRTVEIELSLAAGRNEIRLDLVTPEALETQEDVLVRMVQISKIEIQRSN